MTIVEKCLRLVRAYRELVLKNDAMQRKVVYLEAAREELSNRVIELQGDLSDLRTYFEDCEKERKFLDEEYRRGRLEIAELKIAALAPKKPATKKPKGK